MEKKIHTGKILLITSLTVNLFLLLLLYVNLHLVPILTNYFLSLMLLY